MIVNLVYQQLELTKQIDQAHKEMDLLKKEFDSKKAFLDVANMDRYAKKRHNSNAMSVIRLLLNKVQECPGNSFLDVSSEFATPEVVAIVSEEMKQMGFHVYAEKENNTSRWVYYISFPKLESQPQAPNSPGTKE